ncbi:hypothetical protein [Rhodococcoides navarretei]|uniref:ANTAR domain-containing protein n=1 Tax=Rhodococcus navarretei TaxID=3128981 RepID=A0ABU9D1J7_9NOCA
MRSDLGRLTTALDSSGVDLASLVGRLYSDLDSAVAAMVSMALTVVVDGDCFEVSVSHESSCDHVPLSSLRLTLSDARNTDTEQFLLIRSGAAGALVNFAADAGRTLGLAGDSAVVDRHLDQAGESGLPEPSARDLEASSEVNQAIGVLIAGGRSAAEGRAELHRLTAQSGRSTSEVARRTLRDARGWFPPRGP